MEMRIRLGCFLGVFVVMALWELVAPRRPLAVSKGRRWFCNLGIIGLDSVVMRLAFPVAAAGVTLLAHEHQWGLFNNVGVHFALAIVLSVLLLDVVIYLQHAAFHFLPLLWRMHRMHHTDRDLDVSSGLRFHPFEIIISMLIKMTAIVLIGPPLVAVIAFEVILNATSLFNHGNVRIPLAIDRVLRLLIVTPDMHRVHHSIITKETDSNFGFSLSCWDHLFGTYRAQPKEGHDAMTIGLSEHQTDGPQKLWWMLLIPFR
jgi:sterol desaturase/sphingolipid hydroxylase (fatty acid hydroxylase superfamily)